MSGVELLRSLVDPVRELDVVGRVGSPRSSFTLDAASLEGDSLLLEFRSHYADPVERDLRHGRPVHVRLGPLPLVRARRDGDCVVVDAPDVSVEATWLSARPSRAWSILLERGYYEPVLHWRPFSSLNSATLPDRWWHLCDREVSFDTWVAPARPYGGPECLGGAIDPLVVLAHELDSGPVRADSHPLASSRDVDVSGLVTWLVQRGGRAEVLPVLDERPLVADGFPMTALTLARILACDDRSRAERLLVDILGSRDRHHSAHEWQLNRGYAEQILRRLGGPSCWRSVSGSRG